MVRRVGCRLTDKRNPRPGHSGGNGLAAGLGVAEALEAVAETALERRRRVGIEGDEIPKRLRLVFAEIGEGGGVGVGMPGNVLADGTVRMTSEAVQRPGIGARVFADEAEEVEIFFGRLLGKLFEHFGLGFGAEDETDLFIPSGVDAVQLAGALVDELFEDAALLLHARDGKMRAFKGIQDAEKVLAFAEDDLRGAPDAAIFLFFELHKIRTSHDLMLPIGLRRLAKRHVIPNGLM